MFVHVGAKKVAMAGLFSALAVVFLCLATIIEMSSLFFIAAASFCVGISIRAWGSLYGFTFLVATTVVAVFVVPNKMYCITFVAMSLYLLGSELIWCFVANKNKMKHRNFWFWTGKYLLFNIMYIPTLIYFPKLLVSGKMNGLIFVVLVIMGQVALFFYDIAHSYIQNLVWNKMKL